MKHVSVTEDSSSKKKKKKEDSTGRGNQKSGGRERQRESSDLSDILIQADPEATYPLQLLLHETKIQRADWMR